MREREYGKNVNEQMAFEKDVRGTSGKVERFSRREGKCELEIYYPYLNPNLSKSVLI